MNLITQKVTPDTHQKVCLDMKVLYRGEDISHYCTGLVLAKYKEPESVVVKELFGMVFHG